jgi:photosystem II stability/assembly factor-like uncharacterized protein
MKILALILFLLICGLAQSQVAVWEQTQGPPGGTVASFCFDGGWTYAGGKGGVFASTDRGDHWTRIGPGNIDVTSIVTLGGYIFVGTEREGVIRSGDRGTTWTYVGSGLPEYFSVSDMATKDGVVFAANHDAEYYGIYRSTDYGKTWSQASTGIDNRAIRRIFATDSALIASAAGTMGSGMFRSTDNGLFWTRLDSNPYAWNAECITKYNGILYGADFENSARVFRSYDDGRTWQAPISGPDDIILSLYANGSGLFAGTYFHGLYQLPSYGPWVNIDQTFPTIGGTDSSIFVTSADGVFRSRSGAPFIPIGWTPKNNGKVTSEVTCLTSLGTAVFAGTNGGGLYRTSDNGKTWNRIDLGKNTFIIDAMNIGGSLFVVATSDYYKTEGGLLVSTDGGSHWAPRNINAPVMSLCAGSGTLYAAAGYSGIFASIDMGSTWYPLPCPSATSIAALGTYVIATAGYGQVFRSTNEGRTWAQITIDQHGSPPFNRVSAISGLMYAGCSEVNEVYQSADSGATWQWLSKVPLGNCDVQGFCGSDDAVFVALSGSGGVIGSMDRGKTWSRYDFNLSKLDVRSLCSTNGYLFAGTGGGGVFRIETSPGLYIPPVEYFPQYAASEIPTDPTLYWPPSEGVLTYKIQVSSDSLFNKTVVDDSTLLATSIQVRGLRHNYLYFWRVWATGPFGSWLKLDSRFTTAAGPFSLSQNYPNPFNAQTIIGFSVVVHSHVTIDIFSILGQRVITLLSDNFNPGDYTTTWSPKGISSGVYFYRMQAGDFVQTRKLLLLK